VLKAVKLRAGFALAVFAFNNTSQQYAIRQAGGFGLSCLQTFLDSDDEIECATAAFQVLATSVCSVRRSGSIQELQRLLVMALLVFLSA